MLQVTGPKRRCRVSQWRSRLPTHSSVSLPGPARPAQDLRHDAGDPRAAITLDNLIRMDSGLALEESDSGFDPVSRMLYLEHDMAAFAEAGQVGVKPGTAWNYTSANTLTLDTVTVQTGNGQAGIYVRDLLHSAKPHRIPCTPS